jgi:3-oxosteroid 1-dehydrogenase
MDTTKESQSEQLRWDQEVDLVVIGGGIGGLCASLFGAIAGLKVLLCEKDSQLGGTTASSGGIAWVPGNSHALRAGRSEAPEQARTYLQYELGENYRPDLADAFLESAPRAIDVLERNSDVKFHFVPWPDYHPDAPGASLGGRVLEAAPFDGRLLGKDFELVRPPYKSLMLFGGMHIDKRKVDDFMNPFRSVSNFLRVVRTFARYGADRLKYSRGTEIGAGNALVARLVYSLLKRNVEIWTKAPLVELKREGNSVLGASFEKDGKSVWVRSRRGVILATGGFPHNRELRTKLASSFPHEYSSGFDGNIGDGILAALKIGARMDKGLASPAYWQPSSSIAQPDGTKKGVMYGYLDRGRPGVVAVDQAGKRFVNESNSYHDVGIALYHAGYGRGNRFFFVCDRDFVWYHGLGLIRPFQWNLKRYAKSGYITMADSIPELAKAIRINVGGLVETITEHNEYARLGHDPKFGKGATTYNRLFGHPRAKPNPNLAPIKRPPFVALQIFPATLGTAVGLDVNADGCVLMEDGKPFRGLYACGNDMASVMRGNYPAAGITLGPSIAFSFRCASHAANSQDIKAPSSSVDPAFTTR